MNACEVDSCGFGLVVDVANHKSSQLIETALLGLARLSHRGAIGEDGLSGDGCGILLQLDHAFFADVARENAIALQTPFAVGMCFLNRHQAPENRLVLEQALQGLGFVVAGWREVPVDMQYIAVDQHDRCPLFYQVFVQYPDDWSPEYVEKKLYLAKRLAIHDLQHDSEFSICSLSSQTIVYKALVLTWNLARFYPDLKETRMQSAVALFHQRFSTNTLPAWALAQPFSTLAHNGEINTIQGNRHYAEQLSRSLIEHHFPELQEITTLVNARGSDSCSMDNVLESLIRAGFSCPEALRLMMPPAWENERSENAQKRAYYQFHAHHLPAWEGPAGIVFFDGRYAGCLLDRNGFRPARLLAGQGNWIGVGSELGIFDCDERTLTRSQQIKTGALFLIDLHQACVVDSDAYENRLYQVHPYDAWLLQHEIPLSATESGNIIDRHQPVSEERCKRFDVSLEEKEQVLRVLYEQGNEATFSMGDDTPLAALSAGPRQLFDFFRQQFAQVTNPPIDSLRETCVMSLQVSLGNQGPVTQRNAAFARQITLASPLLTGAQRDALGHLENEQYAFVRLSLAYDSDCELKEALDTLTAGFVAPTDDQHVLLELSDEVYLPGQLLIHPALAVGALHHVLIRQHRRQNVSIIVSSAWVRDAHHLAMLIACGANAVFPYLAYDLIIEMAQNKKQPPLEALFNYRKAMNKGLLKIASKMGVCTINSYRGAQLFHLIGLSREVVQHCFSQCAYWLERYGWSALNAHQLAAYRHSVEPGTAPRVGGLYKYNWQGEYHDYNPDVVTSLLDAVNQSDARLYQRFRSLINERKPAMVRDLLHLKEATTPIDLADVEAASEIIKRFESAAMSLGALGPEAHESLALAMNRLGARSNSGEGGEARCRNGQPNQSKVRQVASARFGVTAEYLMHAEVIQIKIAQGAKPGEGGQLPGSKVNRMIAELRYSAPGVTLISPPPHHDIYSIEDLAQLIFDLKQINPDAFISVKLVAAPGVGTIAAGVVKAYADMITLSGYDGGTGASPLSSIRYTGGPWELALHETQQVLLNNRLRHRVTLQIDGGLKTGLDVIKAAILGAESFGFGTAPLITLGCKYLQICHLNNCATGVATQDERLREGFYRGLPERVMLYFQWVADDVRHYLAQLGVRRLRDLIGRVDLLACDEDCLAAVVSPSATSAQDRDKLYQQRRNPPFDQGILAQTLLRDALPALQEQRDVCGHYRITNADRSIGANLAGVLARRYGAEGAPFRVQWHFSGVAGQSFGAWLVPGMNVYLDGAANDYVGKGMSGGLVVIKPGADSALDPRHASIAGNTCLYGATGGRCYLEGLVGQRFAVRNSGARSVVLGAGDHACEYMTAGMVLILSTPGHNFGAGMTGGLAFVYDDQGDLPPRCNPESVVAHRLNQPDLFIFQQRARMLLQDYHKETASNLAGQLLQAEAHFLAKSYLVLPHNVSPSDAIKVFL